ncbi:MAG TPA: replication-associated recombination protein A [Nitriliruptoraceae bacterium]|nr:replication-associated recombination protein A [Nitriliruptoraceae bacterium]
MSQLFDPVTGGQADDGRGGSVQSPRTLAGQPLAARMRPTTFDLFFGHEAVVGPDAPLRRMLASGHLTSLVLHGPPGVGKTSLARVISREVDAAWTELSAVTSGVKDLRAAMEEGKARQATVGRRTILFVDEIHRFNKAQQDALLPGVEAGWVTLIGATTENPYFELNAPLLSRCRLIHLTAVDDDAIRAVVDRAVDDAHGLGGRVEVTSDARELIVRGGSGDARSALNLLELAVTALDGDVLDAEDVLDAAAHLRYSRGDEHYDQISAFIKSVRGSDPDAAMYWLMRMLASGEDPLFLARRMVILASEDVGVADSRLLPVAMAAYQAVERVGMPEAEFALSHATIALATAPKSNAVTRAMGAARSLVESHPNAPVPIHLRDAHSSAGKAMGHGEGYDYPHAQPGNWVEQDYLPDDVRGVVFDPEAHLNVRWPPR